MFNLLLFLLIRFYTTLKKWTSFYLYFFFHIKLVKFLQARIVFFVPCEAAEC